MPWALALPIVVPLATAVAALFLRGRARAQRAVSVAGGALLLAGGLALLHRVWQSGIAVLEVGGWPAPMGITLVADHLSATLVAVTGLLGLATIVYSLGEARRDEPLEQPLVHVLLAGVSGSFLAGDLFNFYVWFEVMLVASFALLVGRGARERVRAGVQYVVLNLAGSMLLLAAVGLLYGATGTLSLADLSVRLADSPSPALVTAIATLFLVAFGLKAAVFPLFFWLPDSYPTAPVAVGALFAGLLTKVGVYGLIRVFTLLFTQHPGFTNGLLLVIAVVTMLVGVLGTVAQTDVRRILSFHVVSQVGYLVMGLALATPLALAGAVFFTAHVIVVKASLFLVGGLMARAGGSFELGELGGLYRARPWLAALFLVPALSLAGIPPLSGFWAKAALFAAGLDAGAFVAVAAAAVTGLLTLYSMTKIWAQAFWKEAPAERSAVVPARGRLTLLAAPAVALVTVSVVMGAWAGPFFELAFRSAEELLDPSRYVAAVLGGRT